MSDVYRVDTLDAAYILKIYLHNRHSRGAIEAEVDFLNDLLAFTDFTTSLDKMERVAEGDTLQVRAAVNLDRAPAELFTVELFYMFDNRKNYKIVPMKLTKRNGNIAYYECSLVIEGYGLQNLNARLKPANPTVQALHPELIKWRN